MRVYNNNNTSYQSLTGQQQRQAGFGTIYNILYYFVPKVRQLFLQRIPVHGFHWQSNKHNRKYKPGCVIIYLCGGCFVKIHFTANVVDDEGAVG